MTGHRTGERGFTLLELLAAITVFALLAAILVGGFRFGTRVWEQAEGTSQQVLDIESAQALIRRLLAGALPFTAASEDGGVFVEFVGTTNTLSFVTVAPVQAFVGALHTVTLTRTPAPAATGGMRLMLNVRPYEPSDQAQPRKRRQVTDRLDKSVVLVDRAAAVDFLYFGGDENATAPRWQTTWVDRSTLPLLVAIRVRFAGDDRRLWPDLLVSPVVTEAGF